MRRKLTTKVALGASSFLVLLIFSSLFGVINSHATHQLIYHMGNVVTARMLESGEFDAHVSSVIRESQMFAAYGAPERLSDSQAALNDAYQDLAALTAIESHNSTADSMALNYQALNVRRAALLGRLAVLVSHVQDPAYDRALLFAEIEAAEREIDQLGQDSRSLIQQERDLVAALSDERHAQDGIILAIGISVPIGFFLVALLFLHRGVVRPIREMAQAATAFAQERRAPHIRITSRSEIGVLQQSLNSLVETVTRQTRDLQEQATVAEEIRAQARAAQDLADELQARNEQIATQATALRAEISERRIIEQTLIQARDDAEAANRAKSAFLATMSHELRTPLTAILGYSQLMERALKDLNDTRVQEDLTNIQVAGNHLLSLITDVLDLSRIESGRLSLMHTSFSLNDLAQHVATTAQPLMKRNQNSFSVELPSEAVTMVSDETKVRQILLNLLSNAAKFTEGGTITLSVETAQRGAAATVRFSVTDTGIGIAEPYLSRLFQPFSQADSAATRKYGGAGLGLALSQRLAQALGGAIQVVSAPGHGSTFTLELPLTLRGDAPADATPALSLVAAAGAPAAAPATETPEAQSPPDMAEMRPIALCLTNDRSFGGLLAQLLQPEEILVQHAAVGDDGIRRAAELQPAFILLDTPTAPAGRELIARIKSEPLLQGVPVVLMSSDPSLYDAATDADALLVKPFEPQRLIGVVRAFCLSANP